MAIYNLSVSTYSRRSKAQNRPGVKAKRSQSAVAAAAYRSGDPIYSERDQELKQQRTSGYVLHSDVIAPEDAPEWATDRASLWNAVEAKEKRKDSRLARDVRVSLPRELTLDQQRELVEGYVRETFVSQGMVADINIHSGRASDGKQNPHAHIMLTVRGVSADGWDHYGAGGKHRPWNQKQTILDWRKAWETHTNQALADSGSTERIDGRSNKDRGIEIAPEPKLGPKVAGLEKRGVRTEKGEKQRRIREARERANALQRWADRQKKREQWKHTPRAADMDYIDPNRSVQVEMAFNGQMPPEVRARMEAARQRQLNERERRNKQRHTTPSSSVKRYSSRPQPPTQKPSRGR